MIAQPGANSLYKVQFSAQSCYMDWNLHSSRTQASANLILFKLRGAERYYVLSQTAYIDRANTNQTVFDRADAELNAVKALFPIVLFTKAENFSFSSR